jgi:hypothetical protein
VGFFIAKGNARAEMGNMDATNYSLTKRCGIGKIAQLKIELIDH